MLNKELLRRVRDCVANENVKFSMDTWGVEAQNLYTGPVDEPVKWTQIRRSDTECATSCCIAGWAIVLSKDEEGVIENRYGGDARLTGRRIGAQAFVAANLLGLAPKPEVRTPWLFYPANWPRWALLSLDKLGERKAAVLLMDLLLADVDPRDVSSSEEAIQAVQLASR